MINILIITDDLYYWMGKIQNNCYVDSRTFNKYCCTIYTDMFVFEIRDKIYESDRGKAFSCCIIDKKLDKEKLYNILYPSIKNSIIYGKGGIMNEKFI